MSELDQIVSRTRDYYNAVGARYLELFQNEMEEKPFDRQVILDFARKMGKGAKILDVGCGPCGHISRILADAGCEVTGIDLSETCVSLAQSAQPGLAFEVMNMFDLTFPYHSFDGIVAYYALPYVPRANLPDLLSGFRKILRPGGFLLVVVKEGDGEGWIDDPMGIGQKTFFANFSELELRDLMVMNGFRCAWTWARDPYPSEFAVRRIYIEAEDVTSVF